MSPSSGPPVSGTTASARTVTIVFRVHPDDDTIMTPFLEALRGAWENEISNPGESYEVVSDVTA